VKFAAPGTRKLSRKETQSVYGKEVVNLTNPRYIFLNTLFSGSMGCLYSQLVDAHDTGELGGSFNYHSLFLIIQEAMRYTHLESKLKSTIMHDPEKYIDLDPLTVQALQEQKACGKKLFLATNSGWDYTQKIMSFAFDPYLSGKSWESLFDVVIVNAQKPKFFSSEQDAFLVTKKSDLLKPVSTKLEAGNIYYKANASMVEKLLDASGEEVIYVGDHMYTDINISKRIFGWRTCLIVREIEQEVTTLLSKKEQIRRLVSLRRERQHIDREISRIELQMLLQAQTSNEDLAKLHQLYSEINEQVIRHENKFNELNNKRWGLVMRAGQQKSHIARQIERYADIYTSRVTNFHFTSPNCHFDYISRPMPHDFNIIK
tara:strand:- start:3002 stop:4120 length:1119 start_codon:yes stop_codon:yes gene_type:complete